MPSAGRRCEVVPQWLPVFLDRPELRLIADMGD